LKIPYKQKLVVVGEAIIHFNDFEKINSKLSNEEKYKTQRNLVSGSVRQLDSNLCSERMVHFYAFNVLEGLDDIDSKCDRFETLSSMGFWIIVHSSKSNKTETDTLQYLIESYQDYEFKELTQLPIDGMVYTYDSVSYSNSLKSTSHHPLHSLAYKFEDESQSTTLRDIEWSLGRTGQITPVAIFDSVILDGTEVSRASVHNLSIIEELQLGIGDTITIIKSNMIIPQIQDNLTRSNNLVIPTHCASCNGETIIEQLNDSKMLKCNNPNCPAQLIGRLSHFVSRDAMNIDGLSEATLEKFINKGVIKTFPDIYSLDAYEHEIINMDGFGKRSYTKLINAIEESKNTEMYRLIYALGIPNIGKSSSKIISKYFENDIHLFIQLQPKFDFTELEDFGEISNDSIHKWATPENINELLNIAGYLNIKSSISKTVKENCFSNKTFVVTGSLQNYTRNSIQEKLESLGVKVSGSISKKTDYLLVGTDAGSKLNKAKELGVTILTEIEFEDMLK
jgi:DNA ligase (NAD+)